MGAVGCCEAENGEYRRYESNTEKPYERYRTPYDYSMMSATDTDIESEAPPSVIMNYRGRTMSEVEFVSGFKRAVRAGNTDLAIYFAKQHSELNLLDTRWENNETCLHVGVARRHHSMVIDLLKLGAKPDVQNDFGDTPLHTAVRVGDAEMVTTLLGKCNPWIMNNDQETALLVAKQEAKSAIIQLLEPNSSSTHQGADSEPDTAVIMQPDPEHLPELKAFLQKRNVEASRWQKRWVVVKSHYMLWNDVMRDVDNVHSQKERRKWTNYVDLKAISKIEPVENEKAHRSFTFADTDGSGEEHMWKCANRRERDMWMHGIKKYQKYYGVLV